MINRCSRRIRRSAGGLACPVGRSVGDRGGLAGAVGGSAGESVGPEGQQDNK